MKKITILLLISSLLPSVALAAKSISDLPKLAPLLVDETECRLAGFVGPEFKETYFVPRTDLSGHASETFVLSLTNEEIIASVNANMLQINWSRGNQVVASAQTMIQKSPTQAYVLIVVDPSNGDNQVHLSCNGTNFEMKKRGAK